MDKINKAILKRLRENSRMSWQQIGKEVHLTGQAVAARVQQMEENGAISGFTIRQKDAEKHFITVFMNSSAFSAFEEYLLSNEVVLQAYKISGDGCYHLVVSSSLDKELEVFLNGLLEYGRYRLSSSIRCIK